MAFSEAYSIFLQSQPPLLPSLSFHRLYSLLLDCPHHHHQHPIPSISPPCLVINDSLRTNTPSPRPPISFSRSSSYSHPLSTTSRCPACDDSFFPLLVKELVSVSRYFNDRVRWLLQLHLASGVRKYVIRIKHKQACKRLALIQEGQSLVNYVSMTTLATRTLLEKYDKVHQSNEGSKFRSWLLAMHMEVLQSPWFVELLALYFNLQNSDKAQTLPEMCPGCVCDLHSNKPMLSCIPHESLKLEIDVTCSICLEIVFDPVALKCGHLFCFSCASAAASVLGAKKNAKCPLCREMGVFVGAVRLPELNMLVNRSCKDYFKRRKAQQMKQLQKEYWSYRLTATALV